jgi:D-alanyl-D-alanine carboxypeptidase
MSQKGVTMLATTHWPRILLILVFVSAACSDSSTPATSPGRGISETSPGGPRTYALGEFPDFPEASLPEPTAEALQAVLDEAVQEGTFTGVTAAVIVADRGNWTGATGSLDDAPLTPDSQQPTHSAGKTIVAAQVLRLVEDGRLSLDDRASAHLPPELGFFDANGASIRQVLGMRSGIPDLKAKRHFYPAELASSATEVFRKLPQPEVRPGFETNYTTTNYVLLGTIIEHATERPLAEVLRSDVLDHPGLEGIAYPVEDALAAD